MVDVVIAATGVLHHPRYPDIEDLDSFKGAAFHSSRWDRDVPIDGALIGAVGTGSSTVQIVSAIAERAGRLSLFHRTAQWIMPVPNPPYTEKEKDALRKDGSSLRELHQDLSMLFDGFYNAVVDVGSEHVREVETACLGNLEDNMTDPELR